MKLSIDHRVRPLSNERPLGKNFRFSFFLINLWRQVFLLLSMKLCLQVFFDDKEKGKVSDDKDVGDIQGLNSTIGQKIVSSVM